MLRPRKAALSVIALFSVSLSAMAGAYQPGEVIVKYKDGIFRTRSTMNQMYKNIGAVDVRHYSGLMTGMDKISVEPTRSVEETVAALNLDPNVEYAQPNYILHTMPLVSDQGSLAAQPAGTPCIFPGIPYPPGCGDDGPDPGRPDVIPPPADVYPPVADPSIDQAYGLGKISAQKAWKIHSGDKAFIVADIDTGIDYNHEDLAGNLWRNEDGSDGSIGYDFVHNDALPYDDNGHGTHTAGTIGAVGGNGIGISGVTQRVSLMSLKFLSGQGSGTTADAIRAIDFAIEHGAKVLSNSWGGKADGENKALSDAIDRAKDADVLFIAAAGNDGTDNDGSNPSFPAAFKNANMISVAATDSNDKLASFSNYGKKTTHVAAPGVNVYSTVPGGQYKSFSGTSMACPHVAGAAALVWSYHPEWTYKQVKAQLMDTVDRLSVLNGKTITGGRVNVLRALQ